MHPEVPTAAFDRKRDEPVAAIDADSWNGVRPYWLRALRKAERPLIPGALRGATNMSVVQAPRVRKKTDPLTNESLEEVAARTQIPNALGL